MVPSKLVSTGYPLSGQTQSGCTLLVLDSMGPTDVPELEAAYAAGIFDGEGCVHIAPYLARGRPYHRLFLAVANTDFAVLDWLHFRWGGHVSKTKCRPRCSPIRMWSLTEGGGKPFLEAVLPYLLIKKEQAELALLFTQTKSANTHGRKSDPEAVGRRAELHRRFRELRAAWSAGDQTSAVGSGTAARPPRPEVTPQNRPPSEAAYAAGIFDGEGCVHIAPYRQSGRKYHRLDVTVTNTHFALMDWLHFRWLGYLGKPIAYPGRRPVRIWSLSEGYAKPFLQEILPYLTVKREEARLGLLFIQTKSLNHGRRGDPEAVTRRADLYARLQALQHYRHPSRACALSCFSPAQPRVGDQLRQRWRVKMLSR